MNESTAYLPFYKAFEASDLQAIDGLEVERYDYLPGSEPPVIVIETCDDQELRAIATQPLVLDPWGEGRFLDLEGNPHMARFEVTTPLRMEDLA